MSINCQTQHHTQKHTHFIGIPTPPELDNNNNTAAHGNISTMLRKRIDYWEDYKIIDQKLIQLPDSLNTHITSNNVIDYR